MRVDFIAPVQRTESHGSAALKVFPPLPIAWQLPDKKAMYGRIRTSLNPYIDAMHFV